ncbi:hypothetical protein ACLOJK_040741 [Asimina triloba]
MFASHRLGEYSPTRRSADRIIILPLLTPSVADSIRLRRSLRFPTEQNSRMPSLAIAVFRCCGGHRRSSAKNRAGTPTPASSPQIVLRSPEGGASRRQPLLPKQSSARARLAELAGGTTAECAAICCCCPCGIVNLMVLAVVKLPAGLCRKAIARRKRKVGGLLPPKQQQQLELVKRYDDMELAELERMVAAEVRWPADKSPSVVVVEMEEEMWVQLYGTGFWRNLSERESEPERERQR